ncbi:tetratricopeptide repeat protein [Methanobrevibacter sp.]|uniref:tetratricopeptide repeat protein n=1 Tax=Methanobrevibacter sp. TaxID=66852 RepID=UPI00388D5812
MYKTIIDEIKANLGGNKDLDRKYLSSQIEKYKDHPYNKEILKEISRMMWDCLSDEEKIEFIEISQNENPIMDILNDVSYDIENGEYKLALNKLDKFMESFQPPFEDDKVSEYHFFTNPLEEILFNTYIGAEKEVRLIPDNQPLLDLYYIYGFLLLETQKIDKAEEYLKKAIKINPVSSRIILELCEIYKQHTYNYNKYYMYASDALKYAYYPTDIGRCYRSLGHYYIAENQMKTALALFTYSMEFDLSPMTYSEINYIKSKNNIELTLEESIDIIKNKNIQIGPNPFIIETLENLANEYEENMLLNQSIYFYKLRYNLTKDEKILDRIKELENKINY